MTSIFTTIYYTGKNYLAMLLLRTHRDSPSIEVHSHSKEMADITLCTFEKLQNVAALKSNINDSYVLIMAFTLILLSHSAGFRTFTKLVF